MAAVTHSAPGLGGGDVDLVGVGLGDLLGLGDLDGVGLGDLVGVGLGEMLNVGVGLCDGLALLVLDGGGLKVGLGLRDGLELLVGLGLPDGLELAWGLESGSMLACTAAVVADPQRLRSGTAGLASAGAIAGPDSKKKPAPAATATCPALTTLTGTAALR